MLNTSTSESRRPSRYARNYARNLPLHTPSSPREPSSQRKTPRQVRDLPILPGAAGDRPERNREAARVGRRLRPDPSFVQLSYSLNCSTSLKAPLSIV